MQVELTAPCMLSETTEAPSLHMCSLTCRSVLEGAQQVNDEGMLNHRHDLLFGLHMLHLQLRVMLATSGSLPLHVRQNKGLARLLEPDDVTLTEYLQCHWSPVRCVAAALELQSSCVRLSGALPLLACLHLNHSHTAEGALSNLDRSILSGTQAEQEPVSLWLPPCLSARSP